MTMDMYKKKFKEWFRMDSELWIFHNMELTVGKGQKKSAFTDPPPTLVADVICEQPWMES